MVDGYFPVLERLGERVEDVEEGIMEEPDPGDLNALHILRRDMLLLRKATWPLREVVSRLQRSASALIHERPALPARRRTTTSLICLDIIETYREMVAGLIEIYLSACSNASTR